MITNQTQDNSENKINRELQDKSHYTKHPKQHQQK